MALDPVPMEITGSNLQYQTLLSKQISFAGKESGKLLSNPHLFRRAAFTSILLPSHPTFWTENDTASYDKASSKDGNPYVAGSVTGPGQTRQLHVAWNVLSEARSMSGIDKNLTVEDLRKKIQSLPLSIVGFGAGVNGGAVANGLTVEILNQKTLTLETFGSNSASALTEISGSVTDFASYIGNDGFLHLNIHSTYPSDGTNPSSISLDYVGASLFLYGHIVSVGNEYFDNHASVEVNADTTERRYPFDVTRVSYVANLSPETGGSNIIINFDGATTDSNKITLVPRQTLNDFPRRCKFISIKAESGTPAFRAAGLR